MPSRHAKRKYGVRGLPRTQYLRRPDVVADRKQFGRWECDLIQFRKKFGKAKAHLNGSSEMKGLDCGRPLLPDPALKAIS